MRACKVIQKAKEMVNKLKPYRFYIKKKPLLSRWLSVEKQFFIDVLGLSEQDALRWFLMNNSLAPPSQFFNRYDLKITEWYPGMPDYINEQEWLN